MASSRYRWTDAKKAFITERINDNRSTVMRDFMAQFGDIDVETFQGMFSALRPKGNKVLHKYTEEEDAFLIANSGLKSEQLHKKFKRQFPGVTISTAALFTQRKRLLDPPTGVQWNDENDLYLMQTMDKTGLADIARRVGASKDQVATRRYMLKIKYPDLAGEIRTRVQGLLAPADQTPRPPRPRTAQEPVRIPSMEELMMENNVLLKKILDALQK